MEDQDKGEEMQFINKNQRNPETVRDARDKDLFETLRTLQHFTRQVKEMIVKSPYPAHLVQLYHNKKDITKETNEDSDQSM